MLRIAIAQLDPTVGAFEANLKKIEGAYQQACLEGARLLITPELGVCGYPPHDLINRPEMFERNEKALKYLETLTLGKSCALAVGHVGRNPNERGLLAQNCVTVLEKGKAVFKQAKRLLPTYDVFDEARYFEPATEVKLWECDGLKIAFAICEDLWGQFSLSGRPLYSRGQNPVEEYKNQKADLILTLSASPYEWGKKELREKLHADIARSLGVPLIYVNQVGATDEILFDGGSFALDSQGHIAGRLPYFNSAFGMIELEPSKKLLFRGPTEVTEKDMNLPETEILLRGLVVGIQDYFKKTGFKKVILGLSGGIDSAVVGSLAAKALGRENVLGIAMPSQFSSGHSLEDAETLARNLGIAFQVRPIKFLYSMVSREFSQGSPGTLGPLALENLQSRLRGMMLMTLSNELGALVLSTGNKSELATGYCTLYGDMVGALAPIGDVFKTRVYEIARQINKSWGGVIPERSITKAPSAELRPNQVDQDSLPPYELLDEVLIEYIEKGSSITEIEASMKKKNSDINWVRDILHKLEVNEYKRRQAVPVLKVSPKAFGIGRRIPIAKRWD